MGKHSAHPVLTEDSLRVAVLTTSYPLVPGSSSGIFVARLLNAMPGSIAITVLTPDSCVAMPIQATRCKPRIMTVRYAPKSWQRLAHEPGGLPVMLRRNTLFLWLLPLLVASLFLSTLNQARKHHVIHANWAFNGCIAGLAGLLTGLPVLISLRGEDVSRARLSWFSRLVLRSSIILGHSLVAVSSDMATWLRKSFPDSANKIFVIENGIDESFLAVHDVRSNRPDHLEKIIACTGSLIPRKGHDILLRALSRCSDFPWKLRLAGEGCERERLITLANELGLSGRVDFMGELSPEAIPGFLAEADFFVLPSLSEGRPNVLVEAMAAGLPVIASAIDGVTELVEDGRTGLLFPAGNEHALANLMLNLFRHPTRRSELGAAAREEICTRQLTWSGAAEKYAGLYRKMIEEN